MSSTKSTASVKSVSKKQLKNEGPLHHLMEGLNNPMLTMAIVLLSSQALKRFLDLENAKTVSIIRYVYVASQLLMLGAIYLLRMRVAGSTDPSNKNRLTVSQPPNPFAPNEAPRTETMTVLEYDLRELDQQLKSTVMGMVFMLLLNKYFGLIQPLVMQSILPWKTFLTASVVRIRVYGQHPVESLQRPFKAPSNPLADLLKGSTQDGTAVVNKSKEDDDAIKRAQEEFEVLPSIDVASDEATRKRGATREEENEL